MRNPGGSAGMRSMWVRRLVAEGARGVTEDATGGSRLRHSTRLPPRLTPLSLEVESDFAVDPITRDFAVVHRGGEFLDVNRADIAQGFRGFDYRALPGVFPALWRFRQQFDDFDDFGHVSNSPFLNDRMECLRRACDLQGN